MTIRAAICCVALLVWIAPVVQAAKPEAKPAAKRAAKGKANAAAKSTRALRGKTDILTCRNGTEDRHARIAVVLVGGRADSFAYYSKWKPRTCSIYLQRNRDGYSKWSDNGDLTSIRLERGLFLVEHGKGEYRIVFRDIDRERYCGMDGTINGTLTIRKGSERCELTGIMEEGVPLGQAAAHMEQREQAAASPTPPGAPAAATVTRQPLATAMPRPAARSRYNYQPGEAMVIIGD
jgi:hypothetical protein